MTKIMPITNVTGNMQQVLRSIPKISSDRPNAPAPMALLKYIQAPEQKYLAVFPMLPAPKSLGQDAYTGVSLKRPHGYAIMSFWK